VITEPPLAGATQVIKTLVPETVVVGADGVEGAIAGIIAQFPSEDAVEGPTAFAALT
jgi:hypothetical protein